MNKKQYKNKGFALLLALIISSVAFSIGLSILQITLKQLSLGTTVRGSEIAFQAASAGMECLRFTGNDPLVDLLSGSITVSCLTPSAQIVSDSDVKPNVYDYTATNFDWSASGNNICIGMHMYVFDASSEGASITSSTEGGVKTCTDGDVCTYGFVQGYNKSCSEIAGNISTVQRELSIEF